MNEGRLNIYKHLNSILQSGLTFSDYCVNLVHLFIIFKHWQQCHDCHWAHTHTHTLTDLHKRWKQVIRCTRGNSRHKKAGISPHGVFQTLSASYHTSSTWHWSRNKSFRENVHNRERGGGEGLIFHVINTIKKWSTHLIQTVAKSPFKAFQKVVSKWSCFYILYIVVSPVSNSIRLIRFEVYSLPSLKRKPHTPKKKFGCSCTSRFLKWLGVVLHFELFKLTVQIISFLQNHC